MKKLFFPPPFVKYLTKPVLKKYILSLFLIILAVVVLSLAVIVVKELFRPSDIMGVLLVTPGYPQESWNQPIYDLFAKLNYSFPLRLALLGSIPEYDLHRQLKGLAKEKISRVRVIPLFVFSYQSHTAGLLSLLGLRHKDSRDNKDRFLRKIKNPIEVTGGLDFDPLIGDILLERFRELVLKPEEETAVFFLYGSVNSEVLEHEKNKEIMNKYVNYLKEKGLNFAEVVFVWACHQPDWAQLQNIIEANILKGRKVNILPYLLFSKDQIDYTIRSCIDLALVNTGGTAADIHYNGKTLSPHPNLIKWIENQVANPKFLDREFYQIAN